MALAGLLVVTGRYVEATTGESTHVLLDTRALGALELRHRLVVSSGVTSFMPGMPLSPAGLASLLLCKRIVRDWLAGSSFPAVRRTSTLGGLVPIQIVDDILLHSVLLVVV